MKKKTSRYTLHPEWQTLQIAGLRQLIHLIPACNRLDKLVRTIRTLVRIRQTGSPDIVPLLKACHEKIELLIAESDHIPHLINATDTVALVVHSCDTSWAPLLAACSRRLTELIQESGDISHVIQMLNCISRNTPLIGEADPSAGRIPDDRLPEEMPEAKIEKSSSDPEKAPSCTKSMRQIDAVKLDQLLEETETLMQQTRTKQKQTHHHKERIAVRNELKKLREDIRYLRAVKQKVAACK